MDAEDHQPSDILQALRLGVDYTFTIKLRQLELVVRPLAIVERIRVVNETNEQISKMPLPERTELTQLCVLAMRTIELASTPAPHSKTPPRITVALLEQMTEDELIALYNKYRDGIARLDPDLETITPAALDELVIEAKKNSFDWTSLPRPRLEMLARFLATTAASPVASTPGG